MQIGPAAERWLIQAAAAGTQRLRRKLAEAVDLSKLHGADEVNRALETCARAGRFADGDLASILAHQQRTGGELVLFPAREQSSLQRSTRAWDGFGPHDGHDTAATAAARRARPAAAPAAAAIRPQGGTRGDRDRHQPAVGTRRSPPRPARRGSRRPRPRNDLDAPQSVRTAGRQDVRRVGTQASAIPQPTQNALRTLEWIDRAEVLCVCGPSGTGKSHFIEALGHLAIDRGKTVAWHTLETLAVLVRRHRADDSDQQGDREADPRRSRARR